MYITLTESELITLLAFKDDGYEDITDENVPDKFKSHYGCSIKIKCKLIMGENEYFIIIDNISNKEFIIINNILITYSDSMY